MINMDFKAEGVVIAGVMCSSTLLNVVAGVPVYQLFPVFYQISAISNWSDVLAVILFDRF